jgi:hypothetical protein
MKHGKDNDVMGIKDEKDFVRESSEKRSANGFVNEGMLKWISEDAGQCCVNGQKKLRAKPFNTGFIPVKGIAQFCLRFWPNDQLARHARLLMLALTSLQGDPSPGFLW